MGSPDCGNWWGRPTEFKVAQCRNGVGEDEDGGGDYRPTCLFKVACDFTEGDEIPELALVARVLDVPVLADGAGFVWSVAVCI